MNENELIKKLSNFKHVTPSRKRMLALKMRILDEVDVESYPYQTNRKRNEFQRYLTPLFMIVIILIGTFSISFFQKSIRSILYTTAITLAPNHYEKAELAFSEAEMQVQELKTSGTPLQEIMNSTSLTNAYVTELNLNGEKGKYTKDQCEQLHKDYATYLGLLHESLEQKKQYAYAIVIENYLNKIKIRLSFYRS